jgi:hypothetical protein
MLFVLCARCDVVVLGRDALLLLLLLPRQNFQSCLISKQDTHK